MHGPLVPVVSWALSYMFLSKPLPLAALFTHSPSYLLLQKVFFGKKPTASENNRGKYWWGFSTPSPPGITALILISLLFFRSSRSQMLHKIGFPKNFKRSHRKHLCRSFCFNKVAGYQAGTLIQRKRFRHRCFPVNFKKLLRRPILQNTSELLLLRFEEVIIQNDIKKYSTQENLFLDIRYQTNIYIIYITNLYYKYLYIFIYIHLIYNITLYII